MNNIVMHMLNFPTQKSLATCSHGNCGCSNGINGLGC